MKFSSLKILSASIQQLVNSTDLIKLRMLKDRKNRPCSPDESRDESKDRWTFERSGTQILSNRGFTQTELMRIYFINPTGIFDSF